MYNYIEEKPYTLTDKGSEDVLNVKNLVDEAIKEYGAIRMQEIFWKAKFNTCSSDEMMACVDRLVELNQVFEVTRNMAVMGQHRIFSKRK